jgi:hypothetical protein
MCVCFALATDSPGLWRNCHIEVMWVSQSAWIVCPVSGDRLSGLSRTHNKIHYFK